MLDDDLKIQLKAYLVRLQRPVELVATLDDSSTSAELRELLHEIRDQSDMVTVVEKNDLDVRKPSFLITNPGEDSGVRFAGVPLGHEFTSLVLALLQVGGHPSKEAAELLEQIKGLKGDFHFETFYSLSCHNCPDVVQALNLMSVLNPGITHTAVDGGVFRQEIEEREIMGVPTVLLNGERFGQGRMELAEIVAKIDTGTGAPADISSRTRDSASRWLESSSELVATTRRNAAGDAKTTRASTAAAASANREAVSVSGAVTSMSGTDDPSPSAGPSSEKGAKAATNVSSACRS